MSEETEETTPKKPFPRMDRGRLADLIADAEKGLIFFATQIHRGDDVGMVFMPVMFSDILGEYDPATIGNLYEYYSEAGPRSINGYPCFFSVRVIGKQDWEEVASELGRRRERDKMEREAFAARFVPGGLGSE